MMAEEKNTEDTEIRVKVKDSSVTASRRLLQTNCAFFRTMFDGRFQPSEEVDLSCVAEDISVIKMILKYFNGKHLGIKMKSVMKVLKVAYFLQAQSLIDYCLKFIDKNACLKNAMSFYFDLKEMDLTVATVSNIMKSRFHDYYILHEKAVSLTPSQLRYALNERLFTFCPAVRVARFVHQYIATDLTTERVKVCQYILCGFDFDNKEIAEDCYIHCEFTSEIERIYSSIESLDPPSDVKDDVGKLVSLLKKLIVDLKKVVDKCEYVEAVVCVVPDICHDGENIEGAHVYMYHPLTRIWYKFDKPLLNEMPADEREPMALVRHKPALKEFLSKSGTFWLHRCKVYEHNLIVSSDSDIPFYRILLPDMCVTKVVNNPYRNHPLCKAIITAPIVLAFDAILIVTQLFSDSDENLIDDVDHDDEEAMFARQCEIDMTEGGIYVDDMEVFDEASVNRPPMFPPYGEPLVQCLVTELMDDTRYIVFDGDDRIFIIHEFFNVFDFVRSGLPKSITVTNNGLTKTFLGSPALLNPQGSDRYAILEVGRKTWVCATLDRQSCELEVKDPWPRESVKVITDIDLHWKSMSVNKLATTYSDSLWVFEGGNTGTGITSLKQFRVNAAMEAEEVAHTPPPFMFCSAMFVNKWKLFHFEKSMKLVSWDGCKACSK